MTPREFANAPWKMEEGHAGYWITNEQGGVVAYLDKGYPKAYENALLITQAPALFALVDKVIGDADGVEVLRDCGPIILGIATGKDGS